MTASGDDCPRVRSLSSVEHISEEVGCRCFETLTHRWVDSKLFVEEIRSLKKDILLLRKQETKCGQEKQYDFSNVRLVLCVPVCVLFLLRHSIFDLILSCEATKSPRRFMKKHGLKLETLPIPSMQLVYLPTFY